MNHTDIPCPATLWPSSCGTFSLWTPIVFHWSKTASSPPYPSVHCNASPCSTASKFHYYTHFSFLPKSLMKIFHESSLKINLAGIFFKTVSDLQTVSSSLASLLLSLQSRLWPRSINNLPWGKQSSIEVVEELWWHYRNPYSKSSLKQAREWFFWY